MSLLWELRLFFILKYSVQLDDYFFDELKITDMILLLNNMAKGENVLV